MPLHKILQESFGFTKQQAFALLDTVSTEKDWRPHSLSKGGEEKKTSPSEIKTHWDLLEFFQIVGKANIFKGIIVLNLNMMIKPFQKSLIIIWPNKWA